MSIDAAEYYLTDAELSAQWPGARALMFAQAQVNPRPLAVFIGAQPGAGKTRTIARVRGEYPDRRFVALDSDVLRRAHPQFADIMRRDPTRMPVLTNQAASAWFQMGLADARAGGYDVLIENTLHAADPILTEAQRFAADGYRVEAVVLAVPEVDSRLGMVSRYFTAVEVGEQARWTNNASHDAGYTGAPDTVGAMEGAPAVDRLVVTDRNGTVHYDSQTSTNTDPTATEALHRVRSIQKSPKEAAEWVAEWQMVSQLAEALGVREDPSVAPVFQRLDIDAAKLGGHQTPGQADQSFRARLQAIRDRPQTDRQRPAGRAAASSARPPDDSLSEDTHHERADGPGHGL